MPGTEKQAFTRDAGMGEGSHFYKIDGKYYIITAWYSGRMKMPAARADMLRRLGRHDDAIAAYREALALVNLEPLRRHLLDRLAELSGSH